MAQIILIEDDKNLRDLISLNLSTFLQAEVIIRENAQEALDLLKILPDIDIVISKTQIANEQSAKELGKFKSENNADYDLIIHGELPPGLSEIAIGVAHTSQWVKIVEHCARILGSELQNLKKSLKPKYVPIPCHYLLEMNEICCDIFIRIGKSAGKYQYIKRINQSDSFSKNEIEQYISQGLRNFYINEDFQTNVTNYISDHLIDKIEQFSGSIEEKIEMLSESYQFAITEISKIGFTPATIQITDTLVRSVIETSKENKHLSNLLHKVINSKTIFLYQAFHMTLIVAVEILQLLRIKETKNYEIMAYASLFHDISLYEYENLSKIYNKDDFLNLSEHEQSVVKNHSLNSTEMLNTFGQLPQGVQTIILEHHGSTQGVGIFTEEYSSITSLSKIFLIAREFVNELLDYKEKKGQPSPIVSRLLDKYRDRDMVNAIRALEKILKKQ